MLNAQLSVFTDDYAAGATFVDFGGAINTVTIDNTVAQSGTSSLKAIVPSSAYVGGAIKAAAAQNLSTYNAVSFWVRASASKTLNVSGISNNGTQAVFQAEYINLSVSTTWKKYIIPIPAPGKLTAEDGLFHFAEGSDEGPYTLWFDDIQYENSPAIGASSPGIGSQTLNPLVGGTFTPGGQTWNVIVNGVNQTINVNLACFDFSSSNNAVATVTNGVGTAVGAGTATITGSLNGVTASGTITVNVGAVSAPMTAAPTPTKPAANVISIFSNAYTNLPNTNWNPNWGQSTIVTDVQIAGNDTKKYQNLNYQGIEFQSAIDASQMQFVHFDIWTPNATAFDLFLINPGPIEKEVRVNPTAGVWNSYDIPLSSFSPVALNNIFQIKLVGTPFGTSLVWMDNLYFYKNAAVTVPLTAAPTPTRPPANVISVFSNAYTNIGGTDWNPNWGQSTVVTDIQIAGNDTKKYENLNYQGIEFTPAINASTMQFVHFDIWTPNATAFDFFLINPGPIEKAVTVNPTAGSWNSYDIPLSSFNTINLSNIFQIKLVGTPFGTSVVYLDNLYFYNTTVISAPTTAAPTPTRLPAYVTSLFSDAYTNVAGIDWNPNWGQSTVVADVTIAGNNTKKYTSMNYQGVLFTPAIDVSNMEFVHFDLWTPNATTFDFYLINPGPIEKAVSQTPTAGVWNSYDIPLTSFSPVALNNIFQIKLQTVPFGSSTVFLDNIYFYRNPALAPLTAAPTPTRLPAFVKSLFSGAYTDVAGTDWNPNWGQSTVVTDVTIAGNAAKKYDNLNYQGVTFSPAIDASDMEFLHFDLWTPNATAFDMFLINPGPIEKAVTVTPTLSGWNSFDIPLTSYNTIALNNIIQFKLVGTPFGTSTVWLDNIYFYKNPPTAPIVAAPTPTRPSANVISLFSNAYTNVVGTDWFPNWGQSTVVADISISGNTTKQYSNLNYQGVQFASPINAASMEYLHLDLWTGTCTAFDVFLINTSPATIEQKVTLTPTAFGWNSFDIPLSSYNTIAMNNIGQFKLVGTPSGCSVFLDNIYFYNTPTLTLSSNSLTIAAPANSTKTFDITSNTSWTASSDQTWLSVGTLSGTGNAIVTLTAQANTSTSATRTATVTIAGPGFTSKIITVVQDKEALFVNASPINLTVNATGTSLPFFDVKSNTNWTVSIDQSWLSSNIVNGSANATITMQAQPNPNITTRTAIVTISASGVADQTISVVQDAAAPSVTLSTGNLTIAAPANSTKTFNVNSNTSWTVASDQSWLTSNIPNGTGTATVTLTAQANPSTSTRTATITVTGSGVTPKIITVTQDGNVPTVAVSSNNVTIAAPANSKKSVDISSNTNWTVISNQTWLTLSSASGTNNATITLTAEENTKTTTRTAEVVVSATGVADQTITVTQDAAGAALSVTTNTLSIAAPANSTKTFDITSNTSWTIESSETWLTSSSPSGADNATITLTAEANPNPTIRTATVTISAAGVTNQVIVVTQDAAGTILVINPSNLTIGAIANSTKGFNITSNIVWTLVSSETWLTANKTNGSNNDTITLTALENPSTKIRTATLTISGSGVGNQTITVTQEGAAAVLTVSVNDISIAAPANSTTTFDIKSNTDWSASSNQTWLNLDKTKGTADSTITLTAEANPNVTTRKATITITAAGVPDQTINVTQEAAAAVLSVSATDLTVAAPANSTVSFDLTSNTNWSVKSNQAWLKSNASGGFGTGNIILTAQENPTSATRKATITISAKGVADIVVTVTQEASVATLSVSSKALTIAATANSIKTFDITSNTSWTISSSETWLALSNASGTGSTTITLTAQENATKAVRTATVTVKGPGVADQIITVTQDFITGVKNLENEKIAFTLYPNPVNDNLFIQLTNIQTDLYDLTINDLNGKAIMTMNQFDVQKSIDASSLPIGVYIIQLKDSLTKSISTQKFIKL
jgi:hypothetical protein